ncbi:unnamed protein product [Heligmosomoides polygyrus]|uniref:MAM domain-containing protein n=1 Tax=Heligmosomoides polygyrus TaxID=6339 RepID=A0A183F825_HELPZ|nr:unnamed protein product [Heligmosomoides polygyrus]
MCRDGRCTKVVDTFCLGHADCGPDMDCHLNHCRIRWDSAADLQLPAARNLSPWAMPSQHSSVRLSRMLVSEELTLCFQSAPQSTVEKAHIVWTENALTPSEPTVTMTYAEVALCASTQSAFSILVQEG